MMVMVTAMMTTDHVDDTLAPTSTIYSCTCRLLFLQVHYLWN